MTTDTTPRCPQCGRLGALGEPCPFNSGYHCIPPQVDDTAPDPNLGLVFGDYLVLSRHAKGGFGSVYLARETTRTSRKIALKLILHGNPEQEDPELSGDPAVGEARAGRDAFAEKFLAEADKLARLTGHPNIVSLYRAGFAQGNPYLAMEFIEGQTLDTAFKRKELDRAAQRTIVAQIGSGLRAAHAIDLVHRDIKPANIMLQRLADNPHHVRLIDFGIAKDLAGGDSSRQALGTPRYMAPEQFRGTGLGPWTDLYALGLIATELITGQRLYPSLRGHLQFAAEKLKATHDPLEQVTDHLPAVFHAPLRRALARDPEDRPPLAEFLAELDEAFALVSPSGFRPVLTIPGGVPLVDRWEDEGTRAGTLDAPITPSAASLRTPVPPAPPPPPLPRKRLWPWVLGISGFLVPSILGTWVMLQNSKSGRELPPPDQGMARDAGRPDARVLDAAPITQAPPTEAPPTAAPPTAAPPTAAPPTAAPPPKMSPGLAACDRLKKACTCADYTACAQGAAHDSRRKAILARCPNPCLPPPVTPPVNPEPAPPAEDPNRWPDTPCGLPPALADNPTAQAGQALCKRKQICECDPDSYPQEVRRLRLDLPEGPRLVDRWKLHICENIPEYRRKEQKCRFGQIQN